MRYGTFEKAKEYSDAGRIAEWLQLFLRSDGKNTALADGLLEGPRFYLPIQEIPLRILENIKSGAPEYLKAENDIEYFFHVVQNMKDSMAAWAPPPLIIEFRDDSSFYVCDGRHRLEMYRQLGKPSAPAILWTTSESNLAKLKGILQ